MLGIASELATLVGLKPFAFAVCFKPDIARVISVVASCQHSKSFTVKSQDQWEFALSNN